ncbi:MAG: hypothetical protein M3203_16815, partial [Actinomycetota bacterium]|nr:hypothetical protein [Actinomycetota bacterium]
MPSFRTQWRVSAVVAAALLVACGSGSGRVTSPSAPITTDPPSPVTTAPTTTAAVTSCRPAPLEERAAAVLALGIGDATRADAPLASRVAALGVGGVILLGVNVVDSGQVKA